MINGVGVHRVLIIILTVLQKLYRYISSLAIKPIQYGNKGIFLQYCRKIQHLVKRCNDIITVNFTFYKTTVSEKRLNIRAGCMIVPQCKTGDRRWCWFYLDWLPVVMWSYGAKSGNPKISFRLQNKSVWQYIIPVPGVCYTNLTIVLLLTFLLIR